MKQLKSDFNLSKYIKNSGVAAFFVGAAILFFACENDIEKIKAFNPTDDLPLAESIDFKTQRTDSGKISFTLKAPKMLQFEREGKKYTEFPEGVDLKNFDQNGNIVYSIRADYAKENVLEDKWEANNNVIATNSAGDTLKTEHLIWEREKGIIYNDEYVKIISADRIIWGEGFTSDEQMSDWKIKKPKGNIFVTVEPEENSQSPQKDGVILETAPLERELQIEK